MRKESKGQKEALLNLKAIDPDVEIREDEITGLPVRIRGILSEPKEGDPETIAREFLSRHKGIYGISAQDEELRLKNIGIDENDNRHVRFHQMYKDLPVFGNEMIVHMNANNVVVGSNGSFIPELDIPDTPKISKDDAVKKILHDDPNNAEWVGAKPLLLVLFREEKPHLAWHLSVSGTDKDIYDNEIPAKWEYFLDALTGKVVWRYNNLKIHDIAVGSGTGNFSGNVSLNTSHDHTTANYCLIDKTLPTNARIYTHDVNNKYPPGPVSCDPDNNWNAPEQKPLVDCHVYSRMVFDYFYLKHGRNSIDNLGADLHIHGRCNYLNNAFWDGSIVKIGYGDGVTFGELCALDIIAHEWTHAVTEHEANLIYNGESGALNESISDIFASFIDGDWLVGEDAWLKKVIAPALRNMQDPTNGGKYNPADPIGSTQKGHQPDHMNDKYSGSSDYGGVHINSGIINKVAYLIAVGGTHRGIKICTGLGTDVLGKILYDAVCNHLTPTSNFAVLRDALLDALSDIYASDSSYDRWRSSIMNAFAAVGIGASVICPPTVCSLKPFVICPPKPGIVCPPKPGITCPPKPGIVCPPKPGIICPPKPIMVCPPKPITAGCLPGPNPGPFDPHTEKRQTDRSKITTKRKGK